MFYLYACTVVTKYPIVPLLLNIPFNLVTLWLISHGNDLAVSCPRNSMSWPRVSSWGYNLAFSWQRNSVSCPRVNSQGIAYISRDHALVSRSHELVSHCRAILCRGHALVSMLLFCREMCTKTKFYSHYFLSSSIKLWNRLPDNIRKY